MTRTYPAKSLIEILLFERVEKLLVQNRVKLYLKVGHVYLRIHNTREVRI
jgi:hypothetical protein